MKTYMILVTTMVSRSKTRLTNEEAVAFQKPPPLNLPFLLFSRSTTFFLQELPSICPHEGATVILLKGENASTLASIKHIVHLACGCLL